MKNFFVLLITLCTLILSGTVSASSTLQYGENEILGVKDPITVEALINYLGQPTSTYSGPNINTPDYPQDLALDKTIYAYNGVRFIGLRPYYTNTGASPEKRVFAVDLIDRSAVTKRGLAVGDSEQKLLEVYGKTPHLRTKPGTYYSGNISIKYDKVYPYVVSRKVGHGINSISFYVANGKIVAIVASF